MNTQGQVGFTGTRDITVAAPVVMVAGPFGSGVEELSALLAQRLGVPCYDPHKLESLAWDREIHDGAWERLKQGVGNFFDYWLSHLHEKPGMRRSEHLVYLAETMALVVREGGVIAGVCPHLMIGGETLFRIRVSATPETCAQRLATLRGGSLEEAIHVYHRMEEERNQFLHDLFEEAYFEPITYDLILDGNNATPQMMMEQCVNALVNKGIMTKAA
ncbi:MAG: cytidylate kinase family protein [Magnetococcales bacterium]|nr:cytidylate kinase family protein [Magnetococcales bacterium]